MSGLCVVSAIVLVCGVLAGTHNWLLSGTELSKRILFGRILEATIAASTVPLFLSIVGNDKMKAVFGPFEMDSTNYSSSFAVFFGFAMIAALFSKNFLDTVSVMQLQRQVEQNKVDIDQATAIVEVEVEDSVPAIVAVDRESIKLEKSELSVLRKLVQGHFSIRSVVGLASSAGLPPDEVVEVLLKLETVGLAKRVRTSKGERWAATNDGRLFILG